MEYAALLDRGHALYPGIRIGRPGRSRMYYVTIAALRALRLRWSVEASGSDEVAHGPAILIGNHVSALDPVAAVMSHWWRVIAFTKVEVFEHRGGFFFRLMGQIPLRRGDEESTRWALDMAAAVLSRGDKVGLYPEGTRSPDGRSLHRLHKRIMIPVLQDNPDVPVHAIVTTYPGKRRGRAHIRVQISPPLPIDTRTMSADEITAIVTDALVSLGNLNYVDEYARVPRRDRA